MSRHPIQPCITDEHGTVRFHGNAIVRYLLDRGPFDMNHLAYQPFSREDREQFAQLIGYSLSGFSELDYVSDDTYATADRMQSDGATEAEARIAALEATLANIREGLRQTVPHAFRMHPDDLVA